MSNIGKQRILFNKKIKVICHGWRLSAKGPNGEFNLKLPVHTKLILKNRYLTIINDNIKSAEYGSLQRKIKSLLLGLSHQHTVNLKLVGVGYKATVENNKIILRLGFSHDIVLSIPFSLKITVFKRNNLKIVGANYDETQQFAYKLRSFRRPEPFKGKGLVFLDEVVRRKEGKKKKL